MKAKERMCVWVSTRAMFRRGDPGWDKYIDFIGLPSLAEARTIDPALNEHIGAGDLRCDLDALSSVLERLPKPNDRQYRLLYTDTQEPLSLGSEWQPLGHDLTDETHTSSLLNCGPWRGPLARFHQRLNRFGLLSLEDARAAREALPQEWGESEPHAFVTIWSLYGKPPAP